MTDTRDSPEQADFRASVRAFVEREIAQHVGARDEAGEFPAEGGRGAEELARAVVACASAPNPPPAFLYPDEATLWASCAICPYTPAPPKRLMSTWRRLATKNNQVHRFLSRCAAWPLATASPLAG
jgi:hypothetical protein